MVAKQNRLPEATARSQNHFLAPSLYLFLEKRSWRNNASCLLAHPTSYPEELNTRPPYTIGSFGILTQVSVHAQSVQEPVQPAPAALAAVGLIVFVKSSLCFSTCASPKALMMPVLYSGILTVHIFEPRYAPVVSLVSFMLTFSCTVTSGIIRM